MKGKAVLFAIMTVEEVDAACAGAAFALNAPCTIGEGINARALPAQNIARTATDFIVTCYERCR